MRNDIWTVLIIAAFLAAVGIVVGVAAVAHTIAWRRRVERVARRHLVSAIGAARCAIQLAWHKNASTEDVTDCLLDVLAHCARAQKVMSTGLHRNQ